MTRSLRLTLIRTPGRSTATRSCHWSRTTWWEQATSSTSLTLRWTSRAGVVQRHSLVIVVACSTQHRATMVALTALICSTQEPEVSQSLWKPRKKNSKRQPGSRNWRSRRLLKNGASRIQHQWPFGKLASVKRLKARRRIKNLLLIRSWSSLGRLRTRSDDMLSK